MGGISLKREISGNFDAVVERITEALKTEGFGILTRIDFHKKMKEKLGKDLEPCVILGACNPALAYGVYQTNADVTSLLPCNVVVRQLSPGRQSVEIARPSALMEILGDDRLREPAQEADGKLERALLALPQA